ncbi:MAG: hypothetical protein M3257_08100 [Actinomycetota bacterium]|nr:hypothetical protein [Actinomycetota bacterium]
MSDAVSFTELDGQHVELLPARTVLSMFIAQGADGGNGSNGGDGKGTLGIRMLGMDLIPGGGNGVGSDGASDNG